jgi:predicted DNA-binding transcriptional regulator AlpA
MLFYYLRPKIDLLLTLLNERMPALPLFEAGDVALPGNPDGSLLRIPDRLEVAGVPSRRSLPSCSAPRTRRLDHGRMRWASAEVLEVLSQRRPEG